MAIFDFRSTKKHIFCKGPFNDYSCSVYIPTTPAYGVYISQLIHTSYTQASVCIQTFNNATVF